MKIFNKNNVYNKNFIIFAHRGVPEILPENTLESFKKAIELKYDGIELDVVLTKEGELVVHHDLDIKFNSKITPIADLTYREIIKQKTPPPSRLEEILSSIGHQTNINIEIKDQGRGKEQIVEKVIDCLKSFNLVHNIIISSFNPQFIKHVKKIDDRLSTAWIWGDKNFYFFNQWKLILNYFKPQAIHIKNNLISDRLVKKIHSQNIKVLAYTINKKETLLSLISKKIDGVFTDSPSILKESKNQDL